MNCISKTFSSVYTTGIAVVYIGGLATIRLATFIIHLLKTKLMYASNPLNQLLRKEITTSTLQNIAEDFPGHFILYLKEGKGKLITTNGPLDLEQNVVYCGSAQQISSSEFTHAKGWYTSFDEELLFSPEITPGLRLLFLTDSTEPEAVRLSGDVAMEMEDLFTRSERESLRSGQTGSAIFTGILKLQLLYLSGSLEKSSTPAMKRRDRELVRRFMTLLRDQFATKKMVTDYAGELFVTPSYLNQVVKKVSGHTASYHIQQQLITEAKRAALSSTKSMKEIAYQLGFDNTSHFSKFFKNNSGINFSSYKKDLMWA